MKNKWSQSIFVLVMLGVVHCFSEALARENEAPDAMSWWREMVANEENKINHFYPKMAVYIGTTTGTPPSFLNFDTEKFNELGFIKTLPFASLEWNIKLNQLDLSTLIIDEAYLKDLVSLVLIFLPVDLIVRVPEDAKEDWDVYWVEGSKAEKIGSFPPPKGTFEPQVIYDYLIKIFGYDGVVIGQKGKYLLIASSSLALRQKKLQALALKDSANKIILKRNEKRGMTLLRLVNARGYIGVFEIVFSGKRGVDVPLSTKILIEN